MTNKDIQILEALVAAGDEATGGELKCVDGLVFQERKCIASCTDYDGEFFSQAVNARPSLKALLDHVKDQERVMQVMVDKFNEVIRISDRKHIAWDEGKQALAQFENMKKEK